MEPDNNMKTKSMDTKKLLIICVCVILCVLIVVAGVVTALVINKGESPDNNTTSETAVGEDATLNSKAESENDQPTESVIRTSSGVDSSIGLKNIKVDSSYIQTDEQKVVAQYFDNDYINITDYEFLARYPSIFDGTQIYFTGTIEKIIKSDDKEYEMLVWVGKNEASFYYRNGNMGEDYNAYQERTKDYLVTISGEQTETRLMTGDEIVVYGRYHNIETQTIDGTSYTIPKICAYRTYFNNNGWVSPLKFDSDFIKKVAKALFGNDIEVRNASSGVDYDDDKAPYTYYADYPFMICEPENQSNARFTKYRMYMQQGIIEDAKSKSKVQKTGTSSDDSEIIRQIEFAADFKHYFIYTFDTSLNSLSVAYYDNDFNKIWQRDFEETVNGVYDYTEKNFYIVANNDLYIIDVETGEDTVKPSYVGEKTNIRKVEDGIVMFSAEKTDSVMKTDLEGNIIWKTNIMNDDYTSNDGLLNAIQFIDNKIIISNHWIAFELKADSGEIVTIGELIN